MDKTADAVVIGGGILGTSTAHFLAKKGPARQAGQRLAVAEWFDRDYYSRSPHEDPQGPEHGFLKVVRGSDWTFVGEGCKINYPMTPPWKSSRFIGFRVFCENQTRQ